MNPRDRIRTSVFRLAAALTSRGVRLPDDVQSFLKADIRGSGRGRRRKEIVEVNAYQAELEDAYEEWAEELSNDLADAETDETDKEAIIAAALIALLALLQELGRRNLPEALFLALGDTAPTPAMLQLLADHVLENDQYLADSFIPDLRVKIDRAITDPDVITAFGINSKDGRDALLAILSTFRSRVALYSGAWWKLYNRTRGSVAAQLGKKVVSYLDKQAKHCHECPEFADVGGKEYESWQHYLETTGDRVPGEFACMSNCRCRIDFK